MTAGQPENQQAVQQVSMMEYRMDRHQDGQQAVMPDRHQESLLSGQQDSGLSCQQDGRLAGV
ncbi:MAG: hypothetical protein LC104_06035 [Bacteroidales bacterium]|nr:hypothetical protein [Bacteroidales bacterium]